MHYYLFEYFQDDLIVVLTNSVVIQTRIVFHFFLRKLIKIDLSFKILCLICSQVPESKSVNGTLNRYNNEANPEAKDVVRVDMVGGFALQKVTSERSYFR